jgi:hypothetical protein
LTILAIRVQISVESKMKRFLIPAAGLVLAAPAHALPIISLHGNGAWHVQFASTTVDLRLLIAGIAALTAVVVFRMLRRVVARQQNPGNT